MIEPFSRKPTNAREWQLRAQVLQKQLEGLSIEELLRGGRIGDALQIGDSDDRRYDPNQPRVPAGHPDGGQWTDKGGHNAGPTRSPDAGRSDETIISDLGGDLEITAAYASRRSRQGPVLINGRPVEITIGQANRLAEAEAQAREAINRVREHDPNWRPHPSAYGTVEGLISAHRADALQARSKFAELQQMESFLVPIFVKEFPRGDQVVISEEESEMQ